ncbi:related to SGD1 - essential nuclear protein, required for biogenesis of the small ribosomal subunit [Melanopsichium pennsylvanicum]|uniref:Related to SGD1 - essential nuclear protein, required for biogenesis of the small ribosomal subunit n=2 Tax=Melanopsichium pennsylvanicum TaxID=63383 RepID=A0AAJ5C866_9BASI|nr:mif4g ma4 domain-containing protein [Melanopsichium pennsylvanicum 4]SNX87662.1 related to SGD1 - essential nuclear protein, required for biogenesis of the small ribosomal subunit [Melanopsichium pennsylvanicum]
MPFDPRTKSRNTTQLPAALRDELGLPAPLTNKRSFRTHDRRFDSRTTGHKPQLKAIGRSQSAINGAAKGTQRGPIKSLRNQEKEQIEQHKQSHQLGKPKPYFNKGSNSHSITVNEKASGSRSSTSREKRQDEDSTQKRKAEEQKPERSLKVIKRPKSATTTSSHSQPSQEPTEPLQTRINPFTGEIETVKPTKKKTSSSALEKMLARAEAGPSTSKDKAKASDGLGGGRRKSRRHLTQQEKEEEDEIRWLEYSLGKSRQGEDVVRDDLDDFLDDLDRFQVGMYDQSESEDNEGSDSDDSGLEEASASEEEESEGSEQESDEDEENDVEVEGGGGSEGELDGLDEEGMLDFDSNDEDDFSNWDAAMATTDEEDEEDEEDDDESAPEEEDDSEAEEARALIAESTSSARSAPSEVSDPASAPAAAATKYVPPALRAKLAAEDSSNPSASTAIATTLGEPEMDFVTAQKLRRQAQGLLNRLGDSNIDTIITEYENLYRAHPRAHVTSTVTQLVLDTITSRSNLIDTFVILHAALVAALHKVVGVEFAAYFVQRLVEELTRHYDALKLSEDDQKAAEDEEEGKGKECLNLTVLACELYNLHVVACPLIYDLIRMLLGQSDSSSGATSRNVGEVDIELLLKTIRSCGHQLRTDDPTSLKSIIALTQTRVSSSAASTRTKFMLERMIDLQKNAKGSKNNANDASNPNSPSGQLLNRMKKYLGGMGKKRTVKSYEALRFGLKDLKDADKKGKWWLVGAAWTGQTDQGDAQGLTKLLPMNARASTIQSSANSLSSPAVVKIEEDETQQRLLELARAQGMNTDARRTVFVTLLTAEDYKQAAENVLMLKLNDVQRREVIRVLVHCVGSESIYNPYYTLIGQEICRNDHGMRITLQYCLWDFLREIGQKEVGGEKFAAALFDGRDEEEGGGRKQVDPRRIANMARAYAWWLTHDCLSLQALKTIDFTLLNARPAHFLGLLLIHLIHSIQAKSPAKTLHLATVTQELKQDKIVKFLQSNLLGGSVDLSRGFLFFLNVKLDTIAQKNLILGEEKDKASRKKMQPLLDTIKQGLRLITATVQGIVQQSDGVGQSVDSDVDVDDAISEGDSVGDDY